ncbi:NAD-dependent epimerase/dehydratase family protein [Microlunatus lacustris]
MRVLLTGAAGFLGQHTRVRLTAVAGHEVVPVGRDAWSLLPDLLVDVDAVIHVAGVNRGSDDQVEHGNVILAQELTAALPQARQLRHLVFANSIQSGTDSPYGRGKARAAELLGTSARSLGASFADVHLPNLFGEHGRPDYNSFVATFVAAVLAGRAPDVVDRPIELLHVQGAAEALIDGLDSATGTYAPTGTWTSVGTVLRKLQTYASLYANGDIPPLLDDLDVDLFNTLRAALFPDHYPLPLPVRADQRGNLVETVRSHGGAGQTFVSTTRPGVTRGEHFHLRKVERFVVLSGSASIRLRKMFDDQVVTFDVAGDQPCIVDMPTSWAHSIANTGDSDLTTLFWTNELFDPQAPDTYPEPVGQPAEAREQVQA